MNFNSILIGSENPDRLVDYYRSSSASRPFEDGGYTGWQIGSGFMSVGAHSEVNGKNAHPGRDLEHRDARTSRPTSIA